MNQAYSTNRQGRRFLVNEGKIYKQTIVHVAKDYKLDFDPAKHGIIVSYTFVFEKLTRKDGQIMKRKHDLDDCIKLFQDALFEALDIDDSFIIDLHAKKREGTPQSIAEINVVDKNLVGGSTS